MDNLTSLLSQYGISKRDLGNYDEIENIAKQNDNIALANELATNGEVEINGETYTYENAPSYIKSLVTETELADGSKVYSVSKQFSDLDGVTFNASSYFGSRQIITDKMRDAREKAQTDMVSLAEFIAWDSNSKEPPKDNAVYKYYVEMMESEYGDTWENEDQYVKDMMMAKAYGDFSASVSTSITMSGDSSLNSSFSSITSYLTNHLKNQIEIDQANEENIGRFNALYGSGAFSDPWNGIPYEYTEQTFDPSKAGAADYLAINKAYEYGDYSLIDMQIEAELGRKLSPWEFNLAELRESKYKQNDLKIDELCEQGYKMMDGDTQFAKSGDAARKKLESAYYFSDIIQTEELAKKAENTQNYYIDTLQQVAIIEGNGCMIGSNYSRIGTDTANDILNISNKNIIATLSAYGINAKEIIDSSIIKQKVLANCEKYGLNYDYEYNLLCNELLSQTLAEYQGTDAESIKAEYNQNSVAAYKTNLKSAYDKFETDTKANKLYDEDKIQIVSYSDIQGAANEKINSLLSESGNFKVNTSINGWMDAVIQKMREGQSISYLKEWVKTSPYISQQDTEKFLKMSNGDLFIKLTDNPDLADRVQKEARSINSPIMEEYYWDAVFDSISSMREDEDVTTVVTRAMNAFSMAYGESLADNMFSYEDGSSVYGSAKFGSKNKALSETTIKTIDDYANRYYTHEFDGAGIPNLIDSYMQREGGIEKLRAELSGISGNASYNHYIVMALSALGEDVSLLNPDSKTFANDLSRYFGRLNRNDEGYDARYADCVCRVAGSFKNVVGFFGDESRESIGELEFADFGTGQFVTTSISDKARSNGSYIYFTEDKTPVLKLGTFNDQTGSVTYEDISLKFTTEEGRKDLTERVEKELNDLIKEGEVSEVSKSALVPDAHGIYHYIPLDRLVYECPSYKEYLQTYESLKGSFSVPNKIGIIWFNDTSDRLKVRIGHFSFIDGNIGAEYAKYAGIFEMGAGSASSKITRTYVGE